MKSKSLNNLKTAKRIAALALTLCLTSAALLGCRNETKLAEDLSVAKSGLEKASALESGEIMVYETLKTDHDVQDKLQSSVKETYIKFLRGGELEYDFTETEKIAATGEMKTYEATSEKGETIVTRDGVVVDKSEAPDIFSYFAMDYDVSEVDSIEVINAGEQTLYTVTMKSDYDVGFSRDGIDYKCEKALYNYYIDSDGVVRTVLSEFTFEADCNGDVQTVVNFRQAAIN